MKLGGRPVVVLSDYKLIKAAFNKTELTGRPDFYTMLVFNHFMNLGKKILILWFRNHLKVSSHDILVTVYCKILYIAIF